MGILLAISARGQGWPWSSTFSCVFSAQGREARGGRGSHSTPWSPGAVAEVFPGGQFLASPPFYLSLLVSRGSVSEL